MAAIFLILSQLISLALSQSDFTYIGQFETKDPSFVELINLDGSGSADPLDLDLVVTNFQAFGEGNGVSAFPNIGRYLRNITNGHAPPKTILADHTLTWYLHTHKHSAILLQQFQYKAKLCLCIATRHIFSRNNFDCA